MPPEMVSITQKVNLMDSYAVAFLKVLANQDLRFVCIKICEPFLWKVKCIIKLCAFLNMYK